MPCATQLDASALTGFHRVLVRIALCVVLAHCLAMLCKYGFGRDMVYGIVPLFDMYEEKNVPTYFSSVNLLLTSALLLLIRMIAKRSGDPNWRAWTILGGIFLLLSIDEFADLRILLSNAVKFVLADPHYIKNVPLLSVAWTLPALVLVGGLGIYLIPFLVRLDRFYSANFIAAGAIYVFAAVGLETFQGNISEASGGVRTLGFTLLVTLEESLEMFSILYFQFILLKYLERLPLPDLVYPGGLASTTAGASAI